MTLLVLPLWESIPDAVVELCEGPVPVSMVVASAIVTGLYALAMAIGLILPAVSYFALFVLSLTYPLRRFVMRLRRGGTTA